MYRSRPGLVAAVFLGAVAGYARGASDCEVASVTAPPGAVSLVAPAWSADGSRIAFVSSQDLAGGNADGSEEVFLLDVPSGAVFQVTDVFDGGFFDVALDADGTRVAFSSDLDLFGGNFDENREVWLFDVEAGAITQVSSTFGAGLGNASPSLSPDGLRIVFVSDQMLPDGSNADGNPEIVLFDADSEALFLVTDTVGVVNRDPVLSGDGRFVFFVSDGDPAGLNPDRGDEIFAADLSLGLLAQLTGGADGAIVGRPSPDASGALVAFASDRDPLGDNGDRNAEIFVVDVATLGVRQVTKATGNLGSFDPSLSADGLRVAFSSDRNLSGRNAEANVEVFRADLAGGDVVAVTLSEAAMGRFPALDADGSRVAFLWTGSPDGSLQLFLAGECAAAPVVPRVEIDILPKSRDNRIDVDSRKLVRVAILTTSVARGDSLDFDAATVAPRSVRFGRGGAREAKTRVRMRDVDRDGDRDLILHFRIDESGIELGDAEACLEGLTADGSPFEGCDRVSPFRKRRR